MHTPETPFLSIITPAYNAEKYIEACAESVFTQSHPSWEWLVVDDGSTDSTYALLEGLAANEPRMRLFKQENKGCASARNQALEHVRGTYFAFLDADDLLHPEMLYQLTESTKEVHVDLLFFGLAEVEEDFSLSKISNNPEASSINYFEDPLQHLYNSYPTLHSFCSRAYKKSTYKDMRFHKNLHHAEDIAFSLLSYKKAKSLAQIDVTLYFYRNTPDSLSRRVLGIEKVLSLGAFTKYLSKEYLTNKNDTPPALRSLILHELTLCGFRSFLRNGYRSKDLSIQKASYECFKELNQHRYYQPKYLPLDKRLRAQFYRWRLSRLTR